jgi:sugar phosphate isomerase/epimerase
MDLALSTRWNAHRHTSGEALVAEIRELGFTHLELGYDLTSSLVPGIRSAIAAGDIAVDSVHNFCPPPLASSPHPEIFTLGHPEPQVRALARKYTEETLRFAAEIGARCVVVHAGNVEMPPLTRKLIALHEQGEAFGRTYEKIRQNLLMTREKKAPAQLELLQQELEDLLPVLDSLNITLALENLPTWEALPTELEMETLLRHFNSPHLRYWHDIGHAAIRETLGLSNHRRWLERLFPYLAGFHVHDVIPPAEDHRMPSFGRINFSLLKPFVNGHSVKVLEPSPRISHEEVVAGLQAIRIAWDSPATEPTASS